MDIKDLRGLIEAYSEVYAPQEVEEAVKGESSETRRNMAAERRRGIKPLPAKEGERYANWKMGQIAYAKRRKMGEEIEEVDEATAMAKRGYDEAPIRQKIAKSTGGGKAADRASALEDRPTYGDANKAKQRSNYARKQRGDFRKTTSSSPGLHGYAHNSDDPKVKAKQAARGAQRGALTPAEKKQLNMEMEYDIFDVVLEFLQAEGYAETLEEAEWMMANMIDEEAVDIILGEEQLDEISQKTATRAKEAFEAWLDEAMTNYEKNRKRAAQRAAARNAARDAGKTGVVPGVGYVSPRRERETWTDESGKTRHAKGL